VDSRTGRLALAFAVSLVIILLRAVAPMPSDGWLFLLIAPIALVAVEFSFTGGFVAAVIAALIVLLFDITGVVDYSYTGVVVRIAAFLIAGAGVGYLVEDRRKRDDVLKDLRHRATDHQQGLQLNDDVVQGLVVAKMALEMGEIEQAQVTLETTLKRAQEIASQRLTHEARLTRETDTTTTTTTD